MSQELGGVLCGGRLLGLAHRSSSAPSHHDVECVELRLSFGVCCRHSTAEPAEWQHCPSLTSLSPSQLHPPFHKQGQCPFLLSVAFLPLLFKFTFGGHWSIHGSQKSMETSVDICRKRPFHNNFIRSLAFAPTTFLSVSDILLNKVRLHPIDNDYDIFCFCMRWNIDPFESVHLNHSVHNIIFPMCD
jgi:hypothetical protein